jgi:phosphoserine aminotransferase
MLCVEDYIDTLQWAKSIGGLSALRGRANANTKAVLDWVAKTPWIENLSSNPAAASNTSVCLKLVDPAVKSQPAEAQIAFVKQMESLLDKEGVAFDVANHRDAPASLRIWCGCTIETSDVAALLPWLDWAFAEAKATLAKAA